MFYLSAYFRLLQRAWTEPVLYLFRSPEFTLLCRSGLRPSGVEMRMFEKKESLGVRGAEQEREVFTQVAEARSRLAGAVTPGEVANANAGLTGALGWLLAIAENYPELRSNQNFIRLQDELAGTENRVAVERQRYNDAVRVYRTDIRRFPNNLFARTFGFGDRECFETDESVAEVPQIAF